MPTPAPGSPATREPWLVVIDLQRVFGDADSPWCLPGFAAIVPRVDALVERFRGRVVFTRFLVPDHPVGSWVDYYAEWSFARTPQAQPLWEIVPDVRRGDAPVVDATTMGKWGEPLLAATGGSRDLVLCGVSTDCCVLSTALAASDGGAWVRVVANACAGSSPRDHQRALDAMRLYGPQIEVVSSGDV